MAKIEYLTATNTDAGGHSNEDSFLLRNYKSNFLAVIADGVGGLDSGELASGFIKKSLDKWFDRNINRFEEMSIDEIKNALNNEIITIHENLCDISEDRGDNFGSTLTLLFLKKWDYLIAQVGDSRAYFMAKNHEAKQITDDQTVAEYERTTGKVIKNIPERKKEHMLMQCMGQRKINPVFNTGLLPLEYSFLLCSDGLSNTLKPGEIDKYMKMKNIPSQDVLIMMTVMARERGEGDNITSIFIRRQKKPEE